MQPKTVIPVHTQNAELFRNFHDNVILPKKGKTFIIVHYRNCDVQNGDHSFTNFKCESVNLIWHFQQKKVRR